MSKYIIDLRPDCKVVQQICVSDDNVGVGARSVELFDALTDDYVKENFKDLLEGEYQRGLEEGKKATFGLVADASNAEYQKGYKDGKKEAESSEAIEQAKADAFNKGMLFKEEKVHDAFLRGVEKGKVQGQNEAWEYARKIVCDESCGGMSMKELIEIFNKGSDAYILRDFTAQQAIEMLKAHEKKQGDKPIIGEVVERYLNGKCDGVGMFLGEDGDYWNCLFWTGAIFGTFAYPSNQFKRTGNVCDITKILEAMKND